MSGIRGLSVVFLLFVFLVSVFYGTGVVCALNFTPKGDWYPLRSMSGDLTAHDPAIAREDDCWWVFHTGTGLQVKSSTDGYVWRQKRPVFADPLSWWRDYAPDMNYNDVWAPDIIQYNGKWWLYYSVSEFGKNNSAIGLVSTDSIKEGNWQDEGVVISSDLITPYNAIDPNLVLDEGDNPWLVFGSWFSGIQLVAIDLEMMKPRDKDSVTTIARRKIGGRAAGIEGPVITYHDDYYYLFVSIDHCCQNVRSDYKIAVGRAREISGPYLDRNGIDMRDGGGTIIDAGNIRYNGVGGQDIYNNELLVRHGYDRNLRGLHVLLISDLNWDEEGWPAIGEKQFNGCYRLQNKESGLFMQVSNYSNTVGARVKQGEFSESNSLEWQIYRKEENFYRIQNRSSHNYLEVKKGSSASDAVIQQGSYENYDYRLWKLIKVKGDYYQIINKASGLLLEASDDKVVTQGIDNGSDRQHWKLEWVTGK